MNNRNSRVFMVSRKGFGLRLGRPVLFGTAIALTLSATAALAETGKKHPPGPPSLAEMDTNGDGKVTVAEAQAALSRGPGRPYKAPPEKPPGKPSGSSAQHQNRPPPGPPPQKAGQPPDGKNPAGNRPGDNRPVGRGPGPVDAAKIDENGDGFISQAEYDSFLASRPKPPKG